jgi:hypothetical protein
LQFDGFWNCNLLVGEHGFRMCDDVACLTNNFISAPPNCGMMKSRSFCFEAMASFQKIPELNFFPVMKKI